MPIRLPFKTGAFATNGSLKTPVARQRNPRCGMIAKVRGARCLSAFSQCACARLLSVTVIAIMGNSVAISSGFDNQPE